MSAKSADEGVALHRGEVQHGGILRGSGNPGKKRGGMEFRHRASVGGNWSGAESMTPVTCLLLAVIERHSKAIN
jgi:hypothetical protein